VGGDVHFVFSKSAVPFASQVVLPLQKNDNCLFAVHGVACSDTRLPPYVHRVIVSILVLFVV